MAVDTFIQQGMSVLDSINEGVFAVDSQWRITAFNRAAEIITGVSRQHALDSRCCDVFRADICERDCALRRTMADSEPVINATAHIINRDGDRVPIRISTALLKDAHGRIIGGVETFQDLSQIEQLQRALHDRYTFEDIVGRSPAMRRLFDILPQIADSSSTVLVEGPSGTGKELFARAIHHLSPRRDGPFIAVNCAALPDSLLESELFGHVAGAFTDARQDKPGRFARADGGTIFLDEIGDISPALQVRLLRILQERVVEPLGGIAPVPIDVRIIAATNRSLSDLVAGGTYREDLYYRVRVIHLALPSLAQRREDIPLLVEHLIRKFNHLQSRDVAGVSPGVIARLMTHAFPGNVRELENIIEQAFVLCRGAMIEVEHLPGELRSLADGEQSDSQTLDLAVMERRCIERALGRHDGNRTLAATDLGIDISTLYRKIQANAIPVPDRDGRGRRPR